MLHINPLVRRVVAQFELARDQRSPERKLLRASIFWSRQSGSDSAITWMQIPTQSRQMKTLGPATASTGAPFTGFAIGAPQNEHCIVAILIIPLGGKLRRYCPKARRPLGFIERHQGCRRGKEIAIFRFNTGTARSSASPCRSARGAPGRAARRITRRARRRRGACRRPAAPGRADRVARRGAGRAAGPPVGRASRAAARARPW